MKDFFKKLFFFNIFTVPETIIYKLYNMKKIIITLSICISVALMLVSCHSNKKCPAYSRNSSSQPVVASIK